MDINREFSNFSRRLERFWQQFEEKAKTAAGSGSSSIPRSPIRALFYDLRSLFTRGVTLDGMRDLLKKDLRDAFHFYTKGIDYSAYESLPWFKRYPAKVLKTFIALANRLSPPRRFAFAVAIVLMLIAMIRLIAFSAKFGQPDENSGIVLFVLSFAIFFILLFMELRDKLDLKGDLEIAGNTGRTCTGRSIQAERNQHPQLYEACQYRWRGRRRHYRSRGMPGGNRRRRCVRQGDACGTFNGIDAGRKTSQSFSILPSLTVLFLRFRRMRFHSHTFRAEIRYCFTKNCSASPKERK